MSDLALSWGAQSELGGWSRGLRLGITWTAANRDTRGRGTPPSWFQLWGVGRQVWTRVTPGVGGEERHLKGAGSASPLPLLGTSQLPIFIFMESKGVQYRVVTFIRKERFN